MPNSQCLGKFETDIFKPVQYRFLKYHFININNINFVINFANSSETEYTGIKLVQIKVILDNFYKFLLNSMIETYNFIQKTYIFIENSVDSN